MLVPKLPLATCIKPAAKDLLSSLVIFGTRSSGSPLILSILARIRLSTASPISSCNLFIFLGAKYCWSPVMKTLPPVLPPVLSLRTLRTSTAKPVINKSSLTLSPLLSVVAFFNTAADPILSLGGKAVDVIVFF